MKLFLINSNESYSYNDILTNINSSHEYCKTIRTNNIYTYLINLLVAIVSDNPVTLIDSDMSNEEIYNSSINELNQKEIINKEYLDNVYDLFEKIKRSKTEITLFTSGTTGQPKKVIHTIPSLLRNVRISEAYCDQVWAFAYNPTHMAGLQVFFQAFLNMNTIVNLFNYSRQDILSSIEYYSITNISATPTFYRMLFPLEQTFNGVTRITLGGEKSDNKLLKKLESIFPNAKFNNVYASTESGSLFATNGEFFQIPENIVNLVKVVDNELLVHRSLLGKSESFVFVNDYYYTGDLIEWQDIEKRTFRFVSRKNELINVGGYKVNPSEVENAIQGIDEIKQVVVYGKSNSLLGNILCADIVLKNEDSLSESEIRNILATFLQDFKIPRRIKFVKEISLTRTGKVKRL